MKAGITIKITYGSYDLILEFSSFDVCVAVASGKPGDICLMSDFIVP